MDTPSQHAISLLSALAITSDRIHEFGYSLFLQTGAASWSSTRSHRISLSGSPFRIHKSETVEQFDRSLGIGVWLDRTANSGCIIFAVDIAYRSSGWFVQSNVEDEDNQRTRLLWNSEEYWADTLDDALRSLEQATEMLIQSPTFPTVAAVLEEIRRETNNA